MEGKNPHKTVIVIVPFCLCGFVGRQFSLLEDLLRRQDPTFDLEQLRIELESPSAELLLRHLLVADVLHELDHPFVARGRRDASVGRNVLHDAEVGASLVRQA